MANLNRARVLDYDHHKARNRALKMKQNEVNACRIVSSQETEKAAASTFGLLRGRELPWVLEALMYSFFLLLNDLGSLFFCVARHQRE